MYDKLQTNVLVLIHYYHCEHRCLVLQKTAAENWANGVNFDHLRKHLGYFGLQKKRPFHSEECAQ